MDDINDATSENFDTEVQKRLRAKANEIMDEFVEDHANTFLFGTMTFDEFFEKYPEIKSEDPRKH